MKMGDGGFRPAYNVQFASDWGARIIVAVDVNNQGSDQGQMLPMYELICTTYGVSPEEYLVDGGFTENSDIDAMETSGTKVFAPLPIEEKQLEEGKDPYAKKPGDSGAMVNVRKRMSTSEAQGIFKQRPSVAEFPNAECRNRGLIQFRVRGLKNVAPKRCGMCW